MDLAPDSVSKAFISCIDKSMCMAEGVRAIIEFGNKNYPNEIWDVLSDIDFETDLQEFKEWFLTYCAGNIPADTKTLAFMHDCINMFEEDGVWRAQNIASVDAYPAAVSQKMANDMDSGDDWGGETELEIGYLIKGLKWASIQAGSRPRNAYEFTYGETAHDLVEFGFWWAYISLLVFNVLPQNHLDQYNIINLHVSGFGHLISAANTGA